MKYRNDGLCDDGYEIDKDLKGVMNLDIEVHISFLLWQYVEHKTRGYVFNMSNKCDYSIKFSSKGIDKELFGHGMEFLLSGDCRILADINKNDIFRPRKHACDVFQKAKSVTEIL